MKCEVVILRDGGKLPIYSTKMAAGMDFFSPEDVVVKPNQAKPTLIKLAISMFWNDPTYYLQLMSRSGIALKNSTVVGAGVIDYDYRKEIGVLLFNLGQEDFIVKTGDRIAQGIFKKVTQCEFEIKDSHSELVSNRTGGFGSTGVNIKSLTGGDSISQEVAKSDLEPESSRNKIDNEDSCDINTGCFVDPPNISDINLEKYPSIIKAYNISPI